MSDAEWKWKEGRRGRRDQRGMDNLWVLPAAALSLLPLMLDEKSAGRSDTEEERAHMSFLPSSGFVLASVCDSAVQRLERGEDGSSVAEGQTMKPDRSPLLALSFDKLVSSSSWGAAPPLSRGSKCSWGREGG